VLSNPKSTAFLIMQKKISLLATVLVLLAACRNEPKSVTPTEVSDSGTTTHNGLSLLTTDNPEWQHGNLRVYPIVADEATIAQNAGLAHVRTLAEGMTTPGFRITERKKFGREEGQWYNGLTVVNKSKDTIYMMSGDVVTGGNQDRVNEHDLIAMPGSVQNISVYCVEQGRSSYYNPAAPAAEKQLAAFKGYYNVASPSVRKAVYSGNQSGVWSAVSKVTADNQATTSTSTYAGLEQENDLKARREEYVRYFTGKFEAMPNVVGMVAVCNGKVIGVEMFGHPRLFQRRSQALLHSYAVEAAAAPADAPTATLLTSAQVESAFGSVAYLADPKRQPTETAGRFLIGKTWAHLYRK
jgi:hypothetical protein